jgi:hypothetical protein
MNLQPTYTNALVPSSHYALNGFWSAIGRAAKRFAARAIRWAAKKIEADTFGVASFISDQLNIWANQLEDSANSSKDNSEAQLTVQETALLGQFAELKLGPFARKAIEKFINQINALNVDEQLEAANKILKLKAALIAYFSNHQTTGLSAIAIEQKLQIIEALFLPIEDVIDNTFDDNFSRMYVQTSVASAEIPDFSNLIDGSFVNQVFETEKLQPNVPITQIPVQTVDPTIQVTTPIVSVDQNTNTPTVSKPSTTKKAVIVIGGLIGSYLLLSGSSSSKN